MPSIATTHTDVTRHPSFENSFMVRLTWYLHMAFAGLATVHATVTHTFANILETIHNVPVQAVWPPPLWSHEFRRPPHEFLELAAKERARWTAFFGFTPRAILLYAGRWSAEKRIHLLLDAVPEGCALVIVGDSDTDYADVIEASRRRDVLPLRRMLDAEALRTAYAACDLVVSASDFEARGNVIVEALSSEVPVAAQPAQGHLEFIQDHKNSYLVDFNDAADARCRLEAIISAGPVSAVLPGLAEVGARLRELDFAGEVSEALLAPALREGASWHELRGCRWLFERVVRAACLLLWLLVWLALWLPVRVYYLLSREPSFVYIAPGCAGESAPGSRHVVPGRHACSERLLNGSESVTAEPRYA